MAQAPSTGVGLIDRSRQRPQTGVRGAGLVWAGASVRAVRALYEWLARLRAAQAALPPGQAPQRNSDRVFNSQLAPHLTRGARAGHPLVRLMQLSQARPAPVPRITGPL